MSSKTTFSSQNASCHFQTEADDNIYNQIKHLTQAFFSSKKSYFFQLLWPVHSLLGYLLFSGPFSLKLRQIMDLAYHTQVLYRILQALLYSYNLILIFTFFAQHTKNKQGIIGIIENLLQFLLKNYSIATKINFFFIAFFLYICFEENILAFALATFVYLIESLFIENYTCKKEENYLTSSYLSLTLRIIIILNVLMNCMIINYGYTTFYCRSLALFGLVSLVWYLRGGINLFLYQLPKTVILLTISLSISIGVLSLINVMQGSNKILFNIVQFVISFVIISICLYFQQTPQDLILVDSQLHHQTQLMKQYQHQLTARQLQCEKNLDQSIFITGLISSHQLQNCSYDLCWTNNPHLYDPALKQKFDFTNLSRQKDSALKFYIKCFYQTALKRNKNKQLMIDYCEFMATEFPDFSTYCLYISELLRDDTLTLVQKIKICKLKVHIEKISANFNKGIYGGRVELMDVLNADDQFDSIMQDVTSYCRQSCQIWKRLKKDTIDLSSVRNQIEQSRSKLTQIDQKWKTISLYFYAQNEWKQVYLNYYLYLKNHHIKNKDLQQELSQASSTSNSYHSMFITRRQKIFEDKKNDCLFFDKESIIFVTELKDDCLFFSKIGKSFQTVLHYQQQEVIGSPLDLIMPANIQKLHHEKFVEWLHTGQSANQNKYNAKIAQVIKKQGTIFTALVIYKIYFGLSQQQSMISFACLVNTKQQHRDQYTIHNLKKHRSFQQNLFLQSSFIQEKHARKVNQDVKFQQQSNIFLKDQQLQPRQHNIEIRNIKLAFRIIAFFYMLLVIACGLNFYQGVSQIQSKAKEAKFLLTLYRYPIGLTTNYLGSYLNITNSTKTISQISSMSNYLLSAVTDKTSIKILSNKQLNLPGNYPPISSSFSNNSIVFDQIDLFFVIYSCLTQLSSKTNTGRTSQAFIRLDSYLKPSFDSMANRTKIQYHYSIQNSLISLKQNERVQIIVVCCVFLLGSSFVCYKLNKYFQKSKDFLDLVVQIDQKHVQKIIQYWKNIGIKFSDFHLRQLQNICQKSQFSTQSLQDQIKSISDNNIPFGITENLNKEIANQAKLSQKRKKTYVSQQTTYYNNRKFYTSVLVLAFMSAAIIAVKIVNQYQVNYLQVFEKEGFNVLRHYPNTQVMGYALINRYYSQTHRNQTVFQPERFVDTISTFQLMSQYEYMAFADQDSVFYNKYKNYFFGNPCTYNSSVLDQADFTLQQCVTWGRSTFSNGISLFLRTLQPQIQGYLGVSQSSRRRTLRRNELTTIASGLSLVAYYIQDLMNTWFDEFSIKIQDYKSRSILTIVFAVFCILLLHIIFLEVILLPNLQRDYAVTKFIFQNFVPEEILVRQKLTRQSFYMTGILQ